MREGDTHAVLSRKGTWVSRQVNPWYTSAPMHELMRAVNAKGWDRTSFEAALLQSDFVKKASSNHFTLSPRPAEDQEDLPPHWKAYEPGQWRYEIELDQVNPSLKKCDVGHASMSWSGVWPYPFPRGFTIIREKETGVPETIFDYRFYCDSDSRIFGD